MTDKRQTAMPDNFGSPFCEVRNDRGVQCGFEYQHSGDHSFTYPSGGRCSERRTVVQGDVEIEEPEPLIAHGAGPAATRRVRRNIWRKS